MNQEFDPTARDAGKSYCMECGGEMRPNVPRLGWDAGAVHVANSSLECPPKGFEPPEYVMPGITVSDTGIVYCPACGRNHWAWMDKPCVCGYKKIETPPGGFKEILTKTMGEVAIASDGTRSCIGTTEENAAQGVKDMQESWNEYAEKWMHGRPKLTRERIEYAKTLGWKEYIQSMNPLSLRPVGGISITTESHGLMKNPDGWADVPPELPTATSVSPRTDAMFATKGGNDLYCAVQQLEVELTEANRRLAIVNHGFGTLAPKGTWLCEIMENIYRAESVEEAKAIAESVSGQIEANGLWIGDRQLHDAAEAISKDAEVYGLAGATNHPAVKCEVKGLSLGHWYNLRTALMDKTGPDPEVIRQAREDHPLRDPVEAKAQFERFEEARRNENETNVL